VTANIDVEARADDDAESKLQRHNYLGARIDNAPQNRGQRANTEEADRSVCRRCFVSGRVQGVYYRAARRRALAFSASPGMHEIADGRVENCLASRASSTRWRAVAVEGPPAARQTSASRR
jgi:acylphosphatase